MLPEEAPPREVLSGRYRFRTPLRCDGVGKLDCVVDADTGQRRVVRWLPLEMNRHEEQNIVHFCAHLPAHPGLPEVCEVGEMESWAYMVVDFPEGDLLSARKTLPKPEVWRQMAFQLSGALGTLHAARTFHGELGMLSVMLLEEEQPLLWDAQLLFCSRMADRRREERVLQQLTRTVHTMAPERARGGPLTPEGDVYSLGAVLAYSAGGGQPEGSSSLALVHAVASGAFRPLLPRGLPLAYRNMLAHMLAPHAASRPSMREVESFFASHLPAPLPDISSPDMSPPRIPPVGVALPKASGVPPSGPSSSPPSSPPSISGIDWIQMLFPTQAPTGAKTKPP